MADKKLGKKDQIQLPNTSGVPISTSTIEKCLELEWQDKREVRSQSWKTIEMSLAIIGGALGAQFVLNSSKNVTQVVGNITVPYPTVAIIGGLLLTISSALGFWICICHSVRESWIMKIIRELEKYLHCISGVYSNPNCMIFYKSRSNDSKYDCKNLLEIIEKGDFNVMQTNKCYNKKQLFRNNDNFFKTIVIFWDNCFNISRVSSLLIFYHLVLIFLAQTSMFLAIKSFIGANGSFLEFFGKNTYSIIFSILDGSILFMILFVLIIMPIVIVILRIKLFFWPNEDKKG